MSFALQLGIYWDWETDMSRTSWLTVKQRNSYTSIWVSITNWLVHSGARTHLGKNYTRSTWIGTGSNVTLMWIHHGNLINVLLFFRRGVWAGSDPPDTRNSAVQTDERHSGRHGCGRGWGRLQEVGINPWHWGDVLGVAGVEGVYRRWV